MKKTDVNELKKRIKKEDPSFTRLTGVYVNSNKEKVTTFSQTFLNMDSEEQFKYVEIAKKIFSGTVENNILTLYFGGDETALTSQRLLTAMKESKLKDDNLTESFIDHLIESYSYPGNYLILLFHDAYDVPLKGEDGFKQGESDYVYEYLLCAICPVALSKAGLGYLTEENRIGSRIRDWVVGAPDTGFVYPAFNDRCADIDSVMFYTKDTSEPHNELMETGLGCVTKRTVTEKQQLFTAIVKKGLGEMEEESADTVLDIQTVITDYVEDHKPDEDILVDTETGVILSSEDLKELIESVDVGEAQATRIAEAYVANFEELPEASHLVDERKVKAGMRARDEETARNYDVVVKAKPEKAAKIETREIDGVRCVVIPLSDTETAAVNGNGIK